MKRVLPAHSGRFAACARTSLASAALSLAGAVLVVGCVDEAPAEPTPHVERELPTSVVPVEGHPDIALPPVVEAPLPGARSRKRMDLDQLNAALRAATGGIGWVEGNNNTDQLVALQATLGKPDFLTTTEEDLTPSPLFQKFLGDAARKVCADLFTAEASRAPDNRVFFVGVDRDESSAALGARLDESLARLLLRFHGRRTDSDATRGALDGWRFLFQSTERATNPATAWTAVCVGLIQHPDFYTY